jgi:hypothetical protein
MTAVLAVWGALAWGADASCVDGRAYRDVLLRELGRAKRSVAVGIYLFTLDGETDAVAEALDDARKRGVSVEVLLDGGGGDPDGEETGRNGPAYRRLEALGVPVYFDDGTLTHAKMIVIEVTGPRPPNVYQGRPLYDPEERERRFTALAAERGAAKTARARAAAALVYADADWEGVRALIDAEDARGPAAVDAALAAMGQKRPDNPRRTMAYLLAMLRGE